MEPNSSSVLVIGQGYVGLPLACELARVGFCVVGLDTNPERVQALNAGVSGVETQLDSALSEAIERGYTAQTAVGVGELFDIVVVCVPTPLDHGGKVDLTAVLSAAEVGAKALKRKGLFVLESTSFPGTTEEKVLPFLEEALGTLDQDFYLAFSPERIDPGNANFDITNTPRIVGGVSRASGEKAAEMYRTFLSDVTVLRGAKEAEMAKLLENTYRQVNIALANELSKVSHEMGIDYWEVLRGASTKPYGFQPFQPGPGVGGHCIPIDPMYLNERVTQVLGAPLKFVELAQSVNNGMPRYVVERAMKILQTQDTENSRVLLLGASYKANVGDRRGAPLDEVLVDLEEHGCEVKFHDPLCPTITISERQLLSVAHLEEAVRDADLVVLLQAHSEYLAPGALDAARAVLDTRGVLDGPSVERL